jgi:glycosyltransferase involved in cell wall biosynthesis
MIALVIPFVDTWDFVEKCIKTAVINSRHAFELIVIDNGSDENYEKRIKALLRPYVLFRYVRNEKNLGVIQSFRQGARAASSDIVCFIHSDVLLQEKQWEKKIEHYFDNDPRLGLAGLLGGDGVFFNGGREHVVSNMQGLEWGKCDCHDVVANHHGVQMTEISPAIVLDGVGLFFRKECLINIMTKTTALDPKVRAPHHWYDRNLTLNAAALGWHTAVIGIGFDHWSGATANTSEKYHVTAEEWLNNHEEWLPLVRDKPIDQAIYNIGEKQFSDEWGSKMPARIDKNYKVRYNS